jgi:hypothetical protein
MATAAIVRDGLVENVIAVNALADVQGPAWTSFLAGADVVLLVGAQRASPGWSYDPGRSPRFLPPPEPEPEEDE